MAIRSICSSSPTLPSLKTLHPLPPPSNKFNVNLGTNEALTEAVSLASAAVCAANEALALANGAADVWFDDDGEEFESFWKVRKRRRRRRKKKVEGFDDNLVKNQKNRLNLSPIEEAEICLCLKEGARLEEARKTIGLCQEHESITKQLSKAIGMRRSEVDKILWKERESQERIIRSYRGLVVSIATGYQGKGLSLQDLIQEGSMGLLRGAKRFNPERGYKLSTYVYWWIKQAIIRAVQNKSRIIRLPGSMCEMVAKIAEANSILSRRLRRIPTDNEIAEILNIHVSTVRLALERTRYPLSLDGVQTDRGFLALKDIIPGEDETRPESMLQKQLKKQELKEILETLSEREENILRLHFGLNGETPMSCEEIGRVLKLSRERVRQISGIALTKLRETSILNNLKVYIV